VKKMKEDDSEGKRKFPRKGGGKSRAVELFSSIWLEKKISRIIEKERRTTFDSQRKKGTTVSSVSRASTEARGVRMRVAALTRSATPKKN